MAKQTQLPILALLVLATLAWAAPEARADKDEREDEHVDATTQDLIERGIALRKGGKDEDALGVLLEAEQRAPNSVRVLLHVTAAAQAAGKWLLAYEYLRKADRYREQPYYQRYKASIHAIEEALALHIGRLRVLGSPRGAVVLLNGQPLGTLPISEPQVLEAGTYSLEVKMAGYFSLSRPISIANRLALSQETVVLTATPSTPSVSASEDRTLSRAQEPTPVREPATPPAEANWVTWTLAGSGAALLATSAVALAVRQKEVAHWNDDTRCLAVSNPTTTRAQLCGGVRTRARSAERIALVSGAAGLGLAGAAVWHYLWSRNATRAAGNQEAELAPACVVNPGALALICQGTF